MTRQKDTRKEAVLFCGIETLAVANKINKGNPF
jgi:hypothetical protein